MNFQRIQQKLIRRLSSPMEYLNALTSHWLMILVIAIGVAAVVAVKAIRERPIYDATATLILTPPEKHMLVRPDKTPRQGSSRNRNREFLAEQMGILQSASVYRLVVTTLGYDKRSKKSLKADDETADASALEEVYEELKARIVDFLADGSAEVPFDSADVRLKSAMGRFANRVRVNPQEKSRQVGLRIKGGNRAVLERELETWIEAYRSVLGRISDEDSLQLENHIATYTAIATKTAAAVDEFRRQHPDVRQSLLDAAKDSYLDQRSYARRLEQDLVINGYQNVDDAPVAAPRRPDFPAPPNALRVEDDPAIRQMRKKIADLKLSRIEDLSKYGPKSYVIRKLDESIVSHEEELERMHDDFLGVISADEEDVADPQDSTTTTTSEEGGSEPPVRRRRKSTAERLHDGIEFAKREERKARQEVERLEGEIRTLQELQTAHKETQRTLKKYEEMKNFIDDRAKGDQTITVRTLDVPTASAVPVNHDKFMKVALGGVGGLLAGFLLALVAEVFCRTVRFKKDVIEEFELEVVGVLPEK